MSKQPVGMAPQDRSERERFEKEVQRIVEAGNQSGVTLRLLGSLAFQIHCPGYGYLQEKMGRAYTDIDFAGYARENKQVRALMAQLGYTENKEVFVVSEGSRAIFDNGADIKRSSVVRKWELAECPTFANQQPS